MSARALSIVSLEQIFAQAMLLIPLYIAATNSLALPFGLVSFFYNTGVALVLRVFLRLGPVVLGSLSLPSSEIALSTIVVRASVVVASLSTRRLRLLSYFAFIALITIPILPRAFSPIAILLYQILRHYLTLGNRLQRS